MKLHHSVLLALAVCTAATSYTVAADETQWNYAENVTFDYSTEELTPNIPESGDIRKTGAGTVFLKLDSTVNPNNDSTIGGTASTFAGDVYIDAGTIYLGSNSTGGMYENYCVSPDALGSTGTIHVGTDGTLALGIFQGQNYWATPVDAAKINKAVSLEGGKLYIDDGRYEFTKTLQVTADSEINNRWSGKSHSFAGINARSNKLTIKGESTDFTFNNGGTIGSLVTEGNQNITFNIENGESLTVSNIDGTLEADTINIKGGAELVLKNGHGWYSGGAVGVSGGTINISNTDTANAVITAGTSGDNTKILSNITGSGTLELRTLDKNEVSLQGTISGDLKILHTSGHYSLKQTNDYTGGTTIKGGGGANQWGDYNHISALADGALGSGDVTMVGEGILEVQSGKTQTNTVNFNSDDTTTNAVLMDASWEGTTLTGNGVTGGTITGGEDGGLLGVTGSHTLTNVTLNDMGVLVDGGTLKLTGDIGGTGTTVMVGSAATPMAEGDDVVAPAGGTLDLSDATTISSNILLNDGATIILGEQGLTMSGTLTLSGTVTIDISDWCKNTEDIAGDKVVFTPYTTLISYAADSSNTFSSDLEGMKVTLIVDGCTNENAWLTIANDGKSLQVVPEPTTATLSLLALAALAARRRRK